MFVGCRRMLSCTSSTASCCCCCDVIVRRRTAMCSSSTTLLPGVVVLLVAALLTSTVPGVDSTRAVSDSNPPPSSVAAAGRAASPAELSSSRSRQQQQPQHVGRDCRLTAQRFDDLKLSDSHAVPETKINANPPLEVCTTGDRATASCCTRPLERHLHQLAGEDARQNILSSPGYEHLSEVVTGTSLHRAKLLDQLMLVANSTRNALWSTYQVDDRGSVQTLFSALADYVQTGDFDIREAVASFLDRLFASLVLLPQDASSRSHDCVAGLRRRLSPVPFDGLSVHMSDDLIRSLGVIHTLLESFALSDDVVHWIASSVVRFEHQCSRALTRLQYCSLCEGLPETTVAPCRPFCLNVARGCLFRLATGGVAARWALFVTNVRELAISANGAYDIERVLYNLESSVPYEVGRMINVVHEYQTQIASTCGNVAFRHRPTTPTPSPSSAGAADDDDQDAEEDGQVDQRRIGAQSLMTAVRLSSRRLLGSKNFFSRLPDAFCRGDPLPVSDSENNCWNGHSVGRYNQSVLRLDEFNIHALGNAEMRVSNVSSEAEKNISAKLDEVTKLLHKRRPPRFSHVGAYGVVNEGSGGGYYNGQYPIDDEDGYASGSGSGDDAIDYVSHETMPVTHDVPSTTTTRGVVTTGQQTTRSTSLRDFIFKHSTTIKTTVSPYIKSSQPPQSLDKPVSSASTISNTASQRIFAAIVSVIIALKVSQHL